MSYLVTVDLSTKQTVDWVLEPALIRGVLGIQPDGLTYRLLVDDEIVQGNPIDFFATSTYDSDTDEWAHHGAPPGPFAELSHDNGWNTNQEALLGAVREERLRFLQETDYTHLLDAPHTSEEIEAFRVYRQELRDITEDLDLTGKHDVSDVVFPTKP